MFCDAISLHQVHHTGGLPSINNGCIWSLDTDGQIEWTTNRHFEHVGSYETKLRIQCDGMRVTLQGNVGRFNRSDNLFGYSVLECIDIANAILKDFGIPAFHAGISAPSRGDTIINTGATITRVDLTENYATGSLKNLHKFLGYLSTQDTGRRGNAKSYGDLGVTWNEGSKFHYDKMYAKHQSLGPDASPEVKQFCIEQGIARHEVSLKSRYLTQKNLNRINNWEKQDAQTMENIVYNRFTEVLHRGTAVHHPLDQIAGRMGHIAIAWRAGADIWNDQTYTIRTRQRFRKALLPYGIDIKQPSNIHSLNTRVDVLNIIPLEVPAWYWNQKAA